VQFHDLNSVSPRNLEADICIVGSGPAGLSVASEFVGTDKAVLIIEGGGRIIDRRNQKLYEIDNIGEPRCLDQNLVRARVFGGTSQLWTGRVASFNDLDYQSRPWINASGWPFDATHLAPYLERSRALLGLGPHIYDDSFWELLAPRALTGRKLDGRLQSQVWQFSRSPSTAGQPVRFGVDNPCADADNISALLNATVTNISLNGARDRLENIEVRSLDGNRQVIKCRTLVLCCGGIENARLLLSSRDQLPAGIGNQHDLVGRYLMDHPYCEIGLFDTSDYYRLIDAFGHHWVQDNEKKHVYLNGMRFSDEIQAQEKLLNCSSYLVSEADLDASWLSAKRAFSSIAVGKIDKQVFRDTWYSLRHSDRLIDGLFRRYIKRRPAIMKPRRIAMGCNPEQMPDPESRVLLSERRNRLGQPIARIDWRISPEETRAARRMAELIQAEFPAGGLPKMKLADWIRTPGGNPHFGDTAHHMGATRMALDEREGVVDANGRVHGIEGLYICGSSVFPTSGTANPTLMIVALSLKTADAIRLSLP